MLLININNAFAYSYTIYCNTWYNVVMSKWEVNCYIADFGCDVVSHAYFCQEYNAIKTNPNIFVDPQGVAVLADGDRIIRIESDDLKNFHLKNKDGVKSNRISKQQFQENLHSFLKTDNGKISYERLKTIAKDLNASIVPVNKIPETNYCPACQVIDAGSPQSKNSGVAAASITRPLKKDNALQLSLAAGMMMPTSDFKTANNMGNATDYSLNAYLPVWQYGGASGGVVNYGGATGGVISFGFNAGIAYFSGNKDYATSGYLPYNITGQTGSPTIAARGTGSPKQAGFKTEAGVQANFSFGSYTISPILNAAYINFKQEAFSVTQNSSVNGQNYDYNLYSQSKSTTSGFAFAAKLRHQYKLGKQSQFSVFAETGYILGPKIAVQSTYLLPEGQPKDNGNYSLNQINNATRAVSESTANFNGWMVNAGVIFSFRGQARAVCSCCGKMVNPETHNKLLCCELKPTPKKPK